MLTSSSVPLNVAVYERHDTWFARLGLDPFVLGILKRGELKPGSVFMVVRPGSTAGSGDGAGDDADT